MVITSKPYRMPKRLSMTDFNRIKSTDDWLIDCEVSKKNLSFRAFRLPIILINCFWIPPFSQKQLLSIPDRNGSLGGSLKQKIKSLQIVFYPPDCRCNWLLKFKNCFLFFLLLFSFLFLHIALCGPFQ